MKNANAMKTTRLSLSVIEPPHWTRRSHTDSKGESSKPDRDLQNVPYVSKLCLGGGAPACEMPSRGQRDCAADVCSWPACSAAAVDCGPARSRCTKARRCPRN